MCGFAGIFHRDGWPVDRDGLLRMARAIAHRGPDGEGIYVDNGSPSAGLVARRLAIIDVANGVQPMSTEDETFTIVYNGEIFNAAEVRGDLESRGHRFRSRCDTEVVLRGYAQWGSDVLSRLNGMWAFAVWDRRSRSLFLSRDRLGIKPLVYAETPQGFVFASEIKALLASGVVGRDLNLQALPHYLSSSVVPEPYSFFRNVRRLPAGCFVVANAEGVRESRYWDCGFEEEDDRGSEHYRLAVRELLEDSIRRQLVSDVPLGVFLSSGLDSGLVAAVAARVLKEPLRTFTLGFEGSSADERPGARRMALALGTRHTEDLLTAQEAAARLPDDCSTPLAAQCQPVAIFWMSWRCSCCLLAQIADACELHMVAVHAEAQRTSRLLHRSLWDLDLHVRQQAALPAQGMIVPFGVAVIASQFVAEVKLADIAAIGQELKRLVHRPQGDLRAAATDRREDVRRRRMIITTTNLLENELPIHSQLTGRTRHSIPVSRPGRSDRDSSLCPTRPQSHARTSAASPHMRRPPPTPAARSANRR